MEGSPAIYLGRIVEKKNFRAYIYGANGEKRLVESWEEFEANMQSGVWFASIEDVGANKAFLENCIPREVKPKPKDKSKAKPKVEKVEEVEVKDDFLPDDGSVFEVTEEDGA